MSAKVLSTALLALTSGACLSNQPADWPEEFAVGWRCELFGGALSKCERVESNKPLAIAVGSSAQLLISLSSEEVATLDPGIDITAIDRLSLVEIGTRAAQDALCSRYGVRAADGRTERTLTSLRGHYSVYELNADTAVFESADAERLGTSIDHLAIAYPTRPCLESAELSVRPFGSSLDPGVALPDDELRIKSVDENLRLGTDVAQLVLLERGAESPLWVAGLSRLVIESALPPTRTDGAWGWNIQDAALEPGNGLPKRGLVLIREVLRQMDLREQRGRTAVVGFEMNRQGLYNVELLQLIDAQEPVDPGRSLEAIAVEPNGKVVAVGFGLVATSTSIDVPLTLESVPDLTASRMILTGEARYPHLFAGLYGQIRIADLHRGAGDITTVEPFGFNRYSAKGLASIQDARGQTWLHITTNEPRSVRWRAGTEDFEEIPLWVPEESNACGNEKVPECGRLRVLPEVRALGLVAHGDDVIQLFAGDECTGIFAISLARGCSVAESLSGLPVGPDPAFRPQAAFGSNGQWLFVSSIRDSEPLGVQLAEVSLEAGN